MKKQDQQLNRLKMNLTLGFGWSTARWFDQKYRNHTLEDQTEPDGVLEV